MPPQTTKRRTTTNLKTKNHQNCQKIELYRNLTTKKLKKKHSSRPVGGAETGSWVERTQGKAGGPGQMRKWLADRVKQQLVDWGPHICMQINWVEQMGSETDLPTQGSSLKPLTEKTYGGCGSGRNSQPHRRVCWRDRQGPRMYTNPPTQESAPEGPNFLVGSRGSD